METIGDTSPFEWEIKGPGTFTVLSNNGKIEGSMASYTFDNDIAKGNIGNSIVREQNLIKSEHIKLDSCTVVDGTHQFSAGGAWFDYGTPELHLGLAQKGVAATNLELYALMTQYPDRDDGQPLYNPLPNLSQNLEKAEKKITASQPPMVYPTISNLTTAGQWVSSVASGIAQSITSNKKEQLKVAAEMTVADLEDQIERQKKYLVDKYGEEMYVTLFKAQVEAGAIYFKEELPYTITKEDIYNAALLDGKAEKRAAWARKVG